MKSFKLIVTEYIVNEYSRLERDVKDAEHEIRWGSYCAHDVAHLQLVKTRFDCFKEFSNHVMILIKITDKDIQDFIDTKLN